MSETELDYVARAMPAFVTEAREQIERFEQLMLELEDAPGDARRRQVSARQPPTGRSSSSSSTGASSTGASSVGVPVGTGPASTR